MMIPESNIKTILAVDCGSATTTAALIEPVNGQYALVASGQTASTHTTPWLDITLGIKDAVRQIEKEAGRVLLAPGGWPMTPQSSSQQGVDAFLVVSSAAAPLSIALAGLMKDITLTSARRAASTTYTLITNEFSLNSEEDNGQRSGIETRVQALHNSQPEVILLVGGTDGGAERPVLELANTISMALQVLDGSHKPSIIFAGNADVRADVAEILGSITSVKSIDNVRPTLDIENLASTQIELEQLYLQWKMSRLPGFEKLKGWSRLPIGLTSSSFEKVIAYIGRHNHLNVIGANIGSGSTMVATQAPEYHGVTIRSDAGVGHSLASLLKQVPPEKFRRWLPFTISSENLHNRLLNKCLHPSGIPTTYEELMIEQAIAREALRLVVGQARSNWPLQPSTGIRDIQWNLLIGAGHSLTKAPQFGQTVMMMLDGLEPWGVASLASDISGVVNMLGALATVQPVAAVEMAAPAHNTFLNLGMVIAPAGHGLLGKPALNLKMIDQSGNTTQEIAVSYGAIKKIDLPPGEKVTLELRPTRHFDIGLGQPGRGAVAEVEGGLLGIIVDARGRPLRLPSDDELRQEQLKLWSQELGIRDGTTEGED